MLVKLVSRILFPLVFLVFASNSADALETREPNTTLAVPEEPPVFGYRSQPAFGRNTFSRPVALVQQPGETDRLFVVEQSGRIFLISDLSDTSPTKSLFMDISSMVDDSESEEGLLGMAFHPDWGSNGYFYLFYTINTSVNGVFGRYDRLARFQIDPANPDAGLAGSELPLISQLDQAFNHNGGDIHFGPDGYLYLSTGDEGGANDQYDNSNHIDRDFFSAILRIDVDKLPGNPEPNPHPAVHLDGNTARYSVPDDNPFIGATSFRGEAVDPEDVRTEFWAVGLRNPWRMSFDAATGLLYCADVGQGNWEEVNIIEKGGDYGWNLREGAHPFQGNSVPPRVDLIDPIAEYPHNNGPAIPGGQFVGISITGGRVYNSQRLAQLNGYYVFADYWNGRIFALRRDPETGAAEDIQQLTTVSQPVAFGIDPSSGDVLIAGLGGQVSRLIYDDTVAGEELPGTLSATGAFSDLGSLTPEAGIVPYELNVPFWSDHAIKSRWFSVPELTDTITFAETGNWGFPSGTVWVKHFDLELTNGVAASRRRLETRFIVRNDAGVHGFTYKWNAEETDADLVGPEGEEETISIYNPDGSLLREQVWHYPSRGECLQCHTSAGGFAAGFNTVQLNKDHDYGNGALNQIEALSSVGYFDEPVSNANTLPSLAAPDDDSLSLEYRVRSYLQANCVSCHQPGGPALGQWDARIATSTDDAGLINGDLVNEQGDAANKVVVPGDLEHSMLLQRITVRGAGQMPPLASNELDQQAIDLLSAWITESLPSRQTFEEYQVALFGSVENPDGAPDFDFDGDGADTWTEWMTGTDATNENDVWEVGIAQAGDEVSIEFEQKANRGFEVQYRTNLVDEESWQVLDVPANAPSYSSSDQPKSVNDTTTEADSRYYRVRVFTP